MKKLFLFTVSVVMITLAVLYVVKNMFAKEKINYDDEPLGI